MLRFSAFHVSIFSIIIIATIIILALNQLCSLKAVACILAIMRGLEERTEYF